jgi:hypothetical protein
MIALAFIEKKINLCSVIRAVYSDSFFLQDLILFVILVRAAIVCNRVNHVILVLITGLPTTRFFVAPATLQPDRSSPATNNKVHVVSAPRRSHPS